MGIGLFSVDAFSNLIVSFCIMRAIKCSFNVFTFEIFTLPKRF